MGLSSFSWLVQRWLRKKQKLQGELTQGFVSWSEPPRERGVRTGRLISHAWRIWNGQPCGLLRGVEKPIAEASVTERPALELASQGWREAFSLCDSVLTPPSQHRVGAFYSQISKCQINKTSKSY